MTKIRRELGIVIFNKELLINTIFTNFNVGDRMINSKIKEKLKSLYTSISYTAAPKATDLLDFF